MSGCNSLEEPLPIDVGGGDPLGDIGEFAAPSSFGIDDFLQLGIVETETQKQSKEKSKGELLTPLNIKSSRGHKSLSTMKCESPISRNSPISPRTPGFGTLCASVASSVATEPVSPRKETEEHENQPPNFTDIFGSAHRISPRRSGMANAQSKSSSNSTGDGSKSHASSTNSSTRTASTAPSSAVSSSMASSSPTSMTSTEQDDPPSFRKVFRPHLFDSNSTQSTFTDQSTADEEEEDDDDDSDASSIPDPPSLRTFLRGRTGMSTESSLGSTTSTVTFSKLVIDDKGTEVNEPCENVGDVLEKQKSFYTAEDAANFRKSALSKVKKDVKKKRPAGGGVTFCPVVMVKTTSLSNSQQTKAMYERARDSEADREWSGAGQQLI